MGAFFLSPLLRGLPKRSLKETGTKTKGNKQTDGRTGDTEKWQSICNVATA